MRNKGGVILLTVIVTLLCIYYLSFSLVTKGINKDATQFATDSIGNVDFGKRQGRRRAQRFAVCTVTWK